MTAQETIRRCNNCRRVITAPMGNACPFCGSDQLSSVNVQRAPVLRHHPAVVTGAVTFCLGLVVLRTLSFVITPKLAVSSIYGDMLWNLQMLIGACTVVYLVLRRGEGDFRALFIIALSLFAAEEGLNALATKFGLFALQGLSMVLNISTFIYSSLALTAGMADGRTRDPFQRSLTGANFGILVITLLRVLLQTSRRSLEDENRVSAFVLLAVSMYVAHTVLRAERFQQPHSPVETKDVTSEPKGTPPPFASPKAVLPSQPGDDKIV